MSTLEAKAQPDAISYGPDALELTARYSRATYKQAKGVQAPPFSGSLPIKRWSVESDKPLTLGHWEFPAPNSNQQPIYVSKSYSITELKAVNLPGTFDYPKWNPPPSGAYTLEGPFSSRVALNPEALATEAQAQALKVELTSAGWKVDGIEENEYGGIYKIFYDSSESRRLLNITVNGVPRNVGLMLREKYTAGIGAPGAWSAPSDGANPIWRSNVPQSSEFGIGEEAIPQRPLMPNEAWAADLFSGWKIMRTDKQPKADTGSAPADSVEVLNKLQNIEAGISQILSVLGAR